MAQFAQVPDLAAYMGRNIDSGDAGAILALELASGFIQGQTQQTIEMVTGDVVTVDGVGRRLILVPEVPIVSVGSLTLAIDGGAAQTLVEGTDFTVDGRKGEIWRIPNWTLWTADRAGIVITYDHGYDPIPSDVKGLCLKIAAKFWSNPTGLTSERTATYSASYSETMDDDDRAVLDRYTFRT